MRKTGIQWTDRTANPLVGCTHVSPGCKNCYAESAAGGARLQQFPQYQGLVDEHGHWTGEMRFVPEVLEQILRLRKPQRIFMPSMSDPFHPAVKDEWLDRIFATIALSPHLTFQLLTKRPERMLEYLGKAYQRVCKVLQSYPRSKTSSLRDNSTVEGMIGPMNLRVWPLSNLWLGVSVENQQAANERIPLLRQAPAAVSFLSCEPLLEAVELFDVDGPVSIAMEEVNPKETLFPAEVIDWVVIGGESGNGARPCQTDWIRSLVEQCRDVGVPCFVKQLGQFPVSREAESTRTEVISREIYSEWVFKAAAQQGFDLERYHILKLKDRKGGNPEEWPEDLRVREFPCTDEAKQ
jgi:protein gp37